jgi:hypothetical protein
MKVPWLENNQAAVPLQKAQECRKDRPVMTDALQSLAM